MSKNVKPIKAIYEFTKTIQRFLPQIKKYRWLLIGSFGALLAEVFLRILEPWPLKFIFDVVIPKVSSTKAPIYSELFQQMDPLSVLTYAVFTVIIIASLRALMAYTSTVGFALAGNRIITRIRTDLYQHIQCLSLSFHSKSKSGDLLIRIMGDIGLLQEVSVTAILPLLANSFVLVGMMIVMLFVNWKLGLIALSIIPLFWLTTLRLSKRLREVSRKQRRIQGQMAATAAESVTAIKTVQALSLEEVFTEKFGGTSHKELKQGVKAKRLAARLERTVDILIALSTAFVLYFGAQFVLDGELTPGDLIVFLAYLKNAFKPLRNFAKYTARLAKASAAAERVFGILDIEPEIKNAPDAIEAPAFVGKVEFHHVNFAYDANPLTLKNIDFKVAAGTQVAIVAPSGTGKSTLMNLILRLYDPSNGSVHIDGVDIRNFTIESLRSQVSIVLQDNLLFKGSVSENISYGVPQATEEEIKEAACIANAHDFIEALPEGYETELAERGATLSAGQRQRIAIARAVIRRSPILILDEPTTGLDKHSEQEVVRALKKASENRTTFMITHNLNLIKDADLILYLKDGSIDEKGTHQELIKSNGSYAQMFRLQDKAHV